MTLLLFAAGCSSSTTTDTTQSSPTTSTTTISATTTMPGAVAPGTPQTATASSGLKVTATPTVVQHHGALLTGPPDSWDLGLVVDNAGPGSFQSVPISQVLLVDSSGQSHAPIIDADPTPPKATPQLGQPSTMAAGGQVRMLLFFVLPAGTTPTTVTYAPFGGAAPSLHWAA